MKSARYGILWKLIRDHSLSGYAAGLLHLGIAEEMMKEVIYYDELSEWRKSIALLEDQIQHLSLAKSFLINKKIQIEPWFSKFNTLHDEITLNRELYVNRSVSLQYRTIAEEMCDASLNKEELDMNMIWNAIDCFHMSIHSSRQFPSFPCLESEARATGKLGLTYSKILKMDDIAHNYLSTSINLFETITHATGSNFYRFKWHQDIRNELHDLRKKKELSDMAQVNNLREPTLLELKPELDAIQAAMSEFEGKRYRVVALLAHIYEKHPPKNNLTGLETLDTDDDGQVKKAALKAILHYHPDKIHNKNCGIKWLVLCEEITKVINELYEYFKNMQT
jgi:hypothetical protein